MRARKKGGSSTKGAKAYHQVSSPSSAFYGTTPETVSTDSSSSETSSLESTSKIQECSSIALDRNGSKEQPIFSSSKAVGVGAYNLEQIVLPEEDEPLRPRDTNSHAKSLLISSSPDTVITPAADVTADVEDDEPLLGTTRGKNSSAFSSSTEDNDDDNISCSSGDELHNINRGVLGHNITEYQALEESFTSSDATPVVTAKPLHTTCNKNKRSSSSSSVRAARSNFQSFSPSTTVTTAAESFTDKRTPCPSPLPRPPPGSRVLQVRSPEQSPTLEQEHSKRQSPKPGSPPPPLTSSRAMTTKTETRSQEAQEQTDEWHMLPTFQKPRPQQLPKLRRPSSQPQPPRAQEQRKAQPPKEHRLGRTKPQNHVKKMQEQVAAALAKKQHQPSYPTKPRESSPPARKSRQSWPSGSQRHPSPPNKKQRQVSPSKKKQQHPSQRGPSPVPDQPQPLPATKSKTQRRPWPPSMKQRQPSPLSGTQQEPSPSSKRDKATTQEEATTEEQPPVAMSHDDEPGPLSLSTARHSPPVQPCITAPIALKRHTCRSAGSMASSVRRHHPDDEMDEISVIEKEKSGVAATATAAAVAMVAFSATTAATTVTSVATSVSEAATLETVYSLEDVGKPELSRDELRPQEPLFGSQHQGPQQETPAPTNASTTSLVSATTDMATIEDKSSGDNDNESDSKSTTEVNMGGASISGSKPLVKSDTAPSAASAFSSSAYKVIKESNTTRKALATEKSQSSKLKGIKEQDLVGNSMLDDSMSRMTITSKVSFYPQERVRYYSLTEEERSHKRSGRLPSLCATEDEVRELKGVLSSLYFEGMESICNIKKGCDSGMSITDMMEEHGPLEFLLCAGSNHRTRNDSSVMSASEASGSFSSATGSTNGNLSSPIAAKSLGAGRASTGNAKKNAQGNNDEDITQRAIQQCRQMMMLYRQRRQGSLITVLDDDDDDDIVLAPRKSGSEVDPPFQVPDVSRIETFEESLIEWPSEVVGSWDGTPGRGTSPKSSSREDVMPDDKENAGSSTSKISTKAKATMTTTKGLSSPSPSQAASNATSRLAWNTRSRSF